MAKKTLYQQENTIHSGTIYCEAGMDDIKKRMIFKLFKEIPMSDIEKIFNVKTRNTDCGIEIIISIEL